MTVLAGLAYLVIISADVCLFFATPLSERPRAWWRYWPLSGFVMYAKWKFRRVDRTGVKP